MSGPNSPESEADEPVSAPEIEPFDEAHETGVYSRAYSAPEHEHFSTGHYVSADLHLYDYDAYRDSSDPDDDHSAARWPWVVGIVAIAAAVALVVSVSLLVTRSDTSQLANPGASTTATVSTTPQQDEITTPKPTPRPSTDIPTPTETQTVTVTATPPPAPPESPPPASTPPPAAPAPAPPTPNSTAAIAPPPATTPPAGPKQVTYSVTGTKAPGDIISITYVDASGRRRTQHNVYIPWSMTVTPISTSDVGSVEAFSFFHISRLNCSITTSDGTVLSSNSNDSPQTSC